MKRYSLFLCMVISLIYLSGCTSVDSNHSQETTDWEPSAFILVNNLDGVTMSVKEGTVSSSGLTVIFENKSDKNCIYGEFFLLEKKINESWYQVPIALEGNYGFDDIGYELSPSDVREWEVDWDWLYGNLETGEYRIVKDILDIRKTGDFDKYFLTAEFTIN